MAGTVLPVAVRGWWRYSGLRWRPLVAFAAAGLFLWAVALATRTAVVYLTAGAVTGAELALVTWGAVNAERARRYGCW